MAPGHGKASDEPVRSEAKQCGQLLLGSRLSAGLPMDLSAEADAFLQQLQSDAAAEAAPAPAAAPAGDAVPAEAPPVVSEPEAAAAPPEGAAQAEAAPAQPAAEPAVAPPAAASQPAPDAAAAGAEPAQQNGGVTDGAEAGANGADGSAEQPRKRRKRWGAPAVEPEAAPGSVGADGQPAKRKRRSRWEDPAENSETALANVLPKEITLPGGIKVRWLRRAGRVVPAGQAEPARS